MEPIIHTYEYAVIHYSTVNGDILTLDEALNVLGQQGYGISGTWMYIKRNVNTGLDETWFHYLLVKSV